jgi:hypothetical protein
LKHILQTISFAKKFVSVKMFDPQAYERLTNIAIVLTKLRNSSRMPRAITYHQLMSAKPEHVIPLLLKYRDFALATIIIEMLELDKEQRVSLSVVYEEWCIQMIRQTTQAESVLIEKFREKFENLAAKYAIDRMGYSVQTVQQFYDSARARNQINNDKITVMQGVELDVDFTRLAAEAVKRNKLKL